MTSDRPQPVTAVVLAAGLGTRMHSRVPKVLHPICGRPMLAFVLDAAAAATGSRPLVVISPATEAVRERFGRSADFAVQADPRGTADAVRAALQVLPQEARAIVVLSGDVPLVGAELISDLAEAQRDHVAAVGLVSVRADDPAGLGRVLRDPDGRISRIIEVADASPDELAIDEVNAGLYAFDVAWLRRRIGDVQPSAVTGELYLTELVAMAREDDLPLVTIEIDDDGTLAGVNDRAQLAEAEQEMRLRINEAHLLAGVTMVDPSTTYIEAGVELAEDVTLEPGVILRGTTSIGRDTLVRTGSQIIDTQVGERCVVWSSVLEESIVESDVSIGPFSHIRKGARIGQGVELGNYAEVKNSVVGAGTKSHHFSYLGDADVGEGVNIGAGTITANFDGQRKHRTRIGDGAFIGSDTILRAPVSIGKGAFTGAASLVTRDVPPGKLVLGVPARLYERAAEVPDPGQPATAIAQPAEPLAVPQSESEAESKAAPAPLDVPDPGGGQPPGSEDAPGR